MSVGHRINRQIRAPFVKLVTEVGEMRGSVAFREALAYAEERGLDLVEVSPGRDRDDQPVCKVLDYGKLRYEENKKKKGSKPHSQVIKEVRVGVNISEHDLQTKHRHIREFLEKRFKVKFTLECSGRQRYTLLGDEKKQFQASFAKFADIAKAGEITSSTRKATVMLSTILTPL
ncbi:MAG: translation initiation factor IF-3 [Candidatus Competibacteraceae bacterium]|nr:translation initiation factor IF-3 [Candidatus Competibacteraceae bacterium]